MPEVGELAGGDHLVGELIWAPLKGVADVPPAATDASTAAGTFLRHWSSHNLEAEALHALWLAKDDLAAAQAEMQTKHVAAVRNIPKVRAHTRPSFAARRSRPA